MAGDLIDWLSINCAALKSVKNQGIESSSWERRTICSSSKKGKEPVYV